MVADESIPETYYLRLRGLPWSSNNSDIANFLKNVQICEGENSILFLVSEEGKRTGDALVRVPTQSDFEKALSYNRNYIGKRYIEVVASNQSEFEENEQKMLIGENDNIVRLRGLPYSSNEKEIRDFLAGTEILPDGVFILVDQEGRCSGDAYVEFAKKEDVNLAIQKHRQKIGSRFIEVYRSNKSEKSYMMTNKPTPLMSINCRRRNKSPPRDILPKYRRSPEKDYLQTYSPPKYHRSKDESRYNEDYDRRRHMPLEEKYIHMRGLPYECNERDIEEFFHPYFVTSIGFCYSQDEKFTGECDVYFEYENDVYRAMNKDKKKIGKRYVELFIRTRKNLFIRKSRGEHHRDMHPYHRTSTRQDYMDVKSFPNFPSQPYDSHIPIPSSNISGYPNSYETSKVKVVSYNEPSSAHFNVQGNTNFTPGPPPVHEYFQDPTSLIKQEDNIQNMIQSTFTDHQPSSHIIQNTESYPFY